MADATDSNPLVGYRVGSSPTTGTRLTISEPIFIIGDGFGWYVLIDMKRGSIMVQQNERD